MVPESHVLVTGGAGFIGSSIAEALLAAGDTVRVLDDFSSGRRENRESLPGKVELVEGTIVDPETVSRAMRGVQVVFHEAAIPSVVRSVERPQASMLAGVQGTTVVLDVARSSGVKRVVFAASSSAYGDTPTLPKVETMPTVPLSPYAASKLTGEHLMRIFAQLYGLETVSLRYFNVFGPRQDPKSEYAAVIPRFILWGVEGKPLTVHGDGTQSRDFTYIDNVVSANLLAARAPAEAVSGKSYNVGCGSRTSLLEIIAMLEAMLGHPLKQKHTPTRVGDVAHTLADIERAKKDMGYAPSVDFDEGLRRTVEFFTGRRP